VSWQYNYDKYSCVWHKGGRYFFWKKAGLQNQSVLYTMVRRTVAWIEKIVLECSGFILLRGCVWGVCRTP
jgi:hypothetical protein